MNSKLSKIRLEDCKVYRAPERQSKYNWKQGKHCSSRLINGQIESLKQLINQVIQAFEEWTTSTNEVIRLKTTD